MIEEATQSHTVVTEIKQTQYSTPTKQRARGRNKARKDREEGKREDMRERIARRRKRRRTEREERRTIEYTTRSSNTHMASPHKTSHPN